MAKPELIDIDKEIRKRVAFNKMADGDKAVFNTYFFQDKGREHGADSVFYDPYFVSSNAFKDIRTISRIQYGGIHCKTLRAVAQKAWIINTCITHTLRKLKPFLKPVSDLNQRGFVIRKIGEDITKTQKGDKEKDRIQDFILNCGNYEDPDRDDFVKYCSKIVRDDLTLDQVATEIQYQKDGKPCAFFAVDAATIEKVIPDTVNDEKAKKEGRNTWKYMQIVDGMPAAAYTTDNMIFDFQNPRTDIYHSMYGYSYVEQAIDLITNVINTFMYNSGNFTENKLPKGMLLVQGDASSEQVEEMEDYIAEIMSGGPVNQWRIPIIPAGSKDSTIEWKAMNTNREMEFQAWLDYLTSGVLALFGCSADEIGIQSQKSQAMFENGGTDRIQAAKSALLGDMLSFLEQYINKIIKKINPEYALEFVGYEKDNPNTIADLDEKECRTWKSVNEKRAEKGLDPIDLSKIENGADIPMNVQLVQLLQAQQTNAGMDGGDMGGFGDDSESDEENEPFDGMEEETPEQSEENNGDVFEEENADMQKSINKSMLFI